MTLFQQIQAAKLFWHELSPRQKDSVVRECLPRINTILRLPQFKKYILGIEDSFSIALMVFIQCMDVYQAEKGNFWTLYNIRFKGALIDYLRAGDVLSRSERAIFVKMKAAEESLDKKFGQSSLEDVSKECGVSVKELESVLHKSEFFKISLTDEVTNMLPCSNSVEEIVLAKEYAKVFRNAASEMLPRDREIFFKIVEEGLTSRAISKDYNVSECRIDQIRKRIINVLREAFDRYLPDSSQMNQSVF